MTKRILPFGIWIILSAAAWLGRLPEARAFRPPAEAPLPNFDKRRSAEPQAQPADAVRGAAAAQLRARVPGARIDWDDLLGTPRHIGSPLGFLTGPLAEGRSVSAAKARAWAADDPHRAVKAFLDEHRPLFGHGPEVLTEARVRRDALSRHNGLRTVAWQQQVDGIPVTDAYLVGHITAKGELVSLSSQFLPHLEQAVHAGTPRRGADRARPVVKAAEAVAVAVAAVGEDVGGTSATSPKLPSGSAQPTAGPPANSVGLAELVPPSQHLGGTSYTSPTLPTTEVLPYDPAPQGPEQSQRFTAGPLPDKAHARLTWLPMNRNTLRLCWRVEITRRQGGERYAVWVDAQTGEALVRRRLTLYLEEASYRVYPGDSPTPMSPGHPAPSTNQPPEVPRVLLTLAALNTNASPIGWISPGYNEPVGNNVLAHLDRDADNQPDLPRPRGAPYRVFDFPVDLTQPPSTYGDAAVVQLFYWCNWMHDRLYELGFDEASGNFQKDNFGRGGLGNDPVLADAQDGSGFNNANFTPTDDGESPRIQMYLFDGPTPDRDGDFDAEVVLHEYAHGLTWRLVGGGYGLWDVQAYGLAEGWSDFYAIALLSEPDDDVDGIYTSGSYVSFGYRGLLENYYFGIRRYPYSTDQARSPLSYRDIDPKQATAYPGIPMSPIHRFDPDNAAQPHRQGEVWCVTLWDARANFIRKYGFEPGNQLFLQVVTDGLKLTPPNPTFLQARDAILQADLLNNEGANQYELWAAFAKRGMGLHASGPPVWTTEGVRESFEMPDPMALMPAGVATFDGPPGGPFAPDCRAYFLSNTVFVSLDWAVLPGAAWIEVFPTSGTLEPGAGTNVTVCLNSAALALPVGQHQATLVFSNLTFGQLQTRVIRLTVVESASMPFVESFESGELQGFWQVSGRGPAEAVIAETEAAAHGGRELRLGTANDRAYARNEVTLALDLAGYTNVTLRFWAKSFNDEPHGPPPDPFLGGADFDGVAISADGLHWHEVQGLRQVSDFYSDFIVDLDAALARHGLAYNSAFRIRFNQYGNRALPNDGLAIDDLQVTGIAPRRFTVVLPGELSETHGLVVGGGRVVLPLPVAETVIVDLVSSDPSVVGVPAQVALLPGQSMVAFDLLVLDNTLLNGIRPVSITASAPGYLTGRATMQVLDDERAALSVSVPAVATEGDGILSGAGQVFASVAPARPIVVGLTSSDQTEVQVPSAVLLPAGRTNVSFDVRIMDDTRIDGPSINTITARVPNWLEGRATLRVLDNDSTNLLLLLPSLASEAMPTLSGGGTVRIAGTLPTNLVVALASADTNTVAVPATVTIPAGQFSAGFTLTLPNQASFAREKSVAVTATAPAFNPDTASLRVLNDDLSLLPFDPTPAHGATEVAVTPTLSWRLGVEELVVNGDFEAGDLRGWIQSTTDSGAFVLNDGRLDPYGPETRQAPFAGNFSVVTQQDGPGARVLYQDVTLPFFVHRITLSWAHRIRNFAGRFAYDHGFRVEVRDLVNSVLLVAFSTKEGDPLLGEWTERAADLTSYRGQRVRLAFVQSDSLGFLNVHLDRVRVLLNFASTVESDIYFGPQPVLGLAHWLGTTTNTIWTLPALAQSTPYYWQVVTRRAGDTQAGPVWQFSTRGVGPVHHFAWSALAPTQYLGAPVRVTLTAQDDLNNTVSNFSGALTLSATRRQVAEPVQILSFVAYADMANEYRRTLGAIAAHFTNFVVATTVATNPATLADQLANKDVFLIVEQETANTAILAGLAAAWAPLLSNFVAQGGTVIACSYLQNEHRILTNAGLLAVTKVRNVASRLVAPGDPHPVNAGLTGSFTAYEVATYDVLDGDVVLRSAQDSDAVVVARQFGLGRVVLIGTDYPTNRTGMDRIIANALQWAAGSTRAALAMTPSRTGYFLNGTWTGHLTPLEVGEEVVWAATDASGRTGTTPPFQVNALNDLAVEVADAPDPVFVGDPVTYAITARNFGPATQTDVVVSNVLPVSATFLGATNPWGSCLLGSNSLVCSLDTLPAGATATLWATASILSGGRITNRVTIAGPLPDPVPANNTAYAVTHADLPGLYISDATATEGHAGPVPLTFNVRLSPPSSQTVVCDYFTSDLSAVSNLDYVTASGTIVFPPGATNQSLTVYALGDVLDEALEVFHVNLTRATNALVVGGQGAGIIFDDDPSPQLIFGDASVVEGPPGTTTNMVFDVRLSAVSGQPVSVNYSTADGTARGGRDYLPAKGVLTFPPGATQQVLIVTVLGDAVSESNEVFYVQFFGLSGATLTNSVATGWIVEDDAGLIDHFTWSTVGATQYVDQPFDVTLTARDGLGNVVTNFSGSVGLSAVIASRDILVGSTDETWEYPMGAYYHDQRVQAIYLAEELGGPQRLSALSLYVATPPGQILRRWTIRLKHTPLDRFPRARWETDGWTTVYQDDEAIVDTGWARFNFMVPFLYNGTDHLLVDLSFNNASFSSDGLCAATPTDTPRALVFRTDSGFGDPLEWGGDTPFPLAVARVPTMLFTADPAAEMSPTLVSNFVGGVWSGQVTVHDLASSLVLRANDGRGHFGSGNPFTVTAINDLGLRLAAAPASVSIGEELTYTLSVSNTGPDAATGVALFDSLPGQARLVSVTPSQGFCTHAGGMVSCYLGELPGNGAATVTLLVAPLVEEPLTNRALVIRAEPESFRANNTVTLVTPVAPPRLFIEDASVVEGDSGTNDLVFTVRLSAPPSQPVTVGYVTKDGSASNAVDYAGQAGTLAFPVGVATQYLTIGVLGDLMDETNETFTVALSGVTNATLGRAQAKGTILDDDPPPALSVNDVTVTEGDSGFVVATFRVSLSMRSAQLVRVSATTSNGTALAGADYTALTRQLLLPPGITNVPVTVSLLPDRVPEPDEFFYLNLSNPSNAVLARAQGVCTILNDDAVPGKIERLDWDEFHPVQLANQPFQVTVRARDFSGGPAWSFVGPVTLAARTDALDAAPGSSDSTTVAAAPLGTGYHDARTQIIYRTNELGGPRRFTALALDVVLPPGQTMHRFTIRLKHTPLSSYSTYAWETTNWTTVFQGDVTLSEPGWATFPFAVPFDYNGTNHLMVDLSFNNGYFTSDGLCRATPTNSIRTLSAQADSQLGDPLNWAGTTAPTPTTSASFPNLRFIAGRDVSILPTFSGNFDQGAWTGQVLVREPGTNVFLVARNGETHVAFSAFFNVLDPEGDSDGDGLPDGWELLYFGSLHAPGGGPEEDPDGDGASNVQEHHAGTHPLERASVLSITAVRLTEFGVQIEFQSALGRAYRIECSPSPSGSPWTVVASNVAGTGGRVTVTDSRHDPPATRFYRVRLL